MGSEEDDFKVFFLLYMGLEAILVMWPRSFEQTFVPLSQGGSMTVSLVKKHFDWHNSFPGEDVWSVWTTEACLSYKLIDEPAVS